MLYEVITDRKHEREIPVNVIRVVAVVHLVVRRASEHVAQPTRPAQPDVRMSQVVGEEIERERERSLV